MTYEEAYLYMKEAGKRGSVYGTETVKELLLRLGNPQDRVPVVHIAGTNGKGSIFAFVGHILENAGYVVGRYISPTIFTYLERFQINGHYMKESEFARIMETVIPVCEDMGEAGLPIPTAFELETAVAFLYFVQKKVDIVLLETGMGGKNDATNVVKQPLCTVLASISRDHMQFLGDTLQEILEQKMGILREQVPCVAYPMQDEMRQIWLKKCDKMQIEPIMADTDQLQVIAEDLHGSRFCYKGQEYELGIPGIYQIYNSITAIEVCNCIKKQYDLKNVNIKNGLKDMLWEGRFQKIKDVPLTYIDGAHNEGGWRSLRENIRAYFTGRPLIYICGVLADKEYEKMVDIMAPFASFIITVTPDNPRALDKEILAERYRSYGKPVDTAEDVFAAQRQAETLAQELTEPVIVVFGSLSFIGPLIPRISSTIKRERTTEKK